MMMMMMMVMVVHWLLLLFGPQDQFSLVQAERWQLRTVHISKRWPQHQQQQKQQQHQQQWTSPSPRASSSPQLGQQSLWTESHAKASFRPERDDQRGKQRPRWLSSEHNGRPILSSHQSSKNTETEGQLGRSAVIFDKRFQGFNRNFRVFGVSLQLGSFYSTYTTRSLFNYSFTIVQLYFSGASSISELIQYLWFGYPG